MKHVLDRPVWTALNASHSHFALGGALAKRYPPAITSFAATGDDDVESLRAFGDLVAPGEDVAMLQADEIVLTAGLAPVLAAAGVQLVAGLPFEAADDPRVQRLTAGDAAEMVDLATLTRPGPFTLQAMRLGEFWGVRIGGRLAAMAGERLRPPGYGELSGVCTHPDFRGQGLARLLSLFVASRITGRGDTPFLHAFATNTAAIALYESIGFRLRRVTNFAVVKRTG